MNTPILPTFIPTSRSRALSSHAKALRRQQRRADFLLFLYSCGLIACLVHLAVS